MNLEAVDRIRKWIELVSRGDEAIDGTMLQFY